MSDSNVRIQDAGALFQIAEPKHKKPAESARRPGRAIGIDLGTTHSVVALANGGAPRALLDAAGKALLPSVVAYLEAAITVGYEAQALAQSSPQQVIASVKRFVGRGLSDIEFAHPYQLSSVDAGGQGVIRFELGGGARVNPVQVSAEILKTMKVRAEAELGQSVDGAVVTVPAYFDDAQRQATKDACRLAGLSLYRLMAEPTAAALAYGLDANERGNFAVYDFGGGTFDLSILRLHEGVFQVLATGGSTALGGDDLDRAIAQHFLDEVSLGEASPEQIVAAQAAARRAKEALSESQSTKVSIPEIGLEHYELSRSQAEACMGPWIDKTLRVCKKTFKDAELRPDELQGVILVGGSTRVPLVREKVEAYFGQAPRIDVDPDLAVAFGAAIQADILSGNPRPGVTLLDVAPLSLGLETMGGMVEKIIARNATIPISARQTFTNYSQSQTGMTITVVQGEREMAKDCRTIAAFELKGIPSLPPGLARVEVTFSLDADGLLTVSAQELTTGIAQRVEVKPSYGLSNTEIDALVADSMQHARDDFQARNQGEARVELGRVLLAVRHALEEHGEDTKLLSEAQRQELRMQLQRSTAAYEDPAASTDLLRQSLMELEAASEAFARNRMEAALRAGMGGQALQELRGQLEQASTAELERKRGGHAAKIVDNSASPNKA